MNRKKCILLVDDEASFTRLMKLNLYSNGPYEVRVENDGGKALETARAYRPDLILLDVIMPDVDGGQIASELRADPALKSIPVVFLTAVVSRNKVVPRTDMETGQTFLAKPVSV